MKERFQADIGANIREFQQKLKQVDAQIRKTASGVDVQISANIRNFLAKVAAIDAKKKEIQRGDSEVTITAAIQGFMRGAALVRAQALALGKKRIVIPIRAGFSNYKNVMGQIANFSRNIGEVASVMGRGGLMFLSPAAVPVVASAIGLIGQLGPMIGTILGSTFALATSFGAAGIGAAGFATVAIPALKGVFDKASEITDLEMKIADAKAAGDIEKANEHLAEMNRIFKDMSGPQLEAHSALRDFQETFRKLVKDMEPGVLTAFSGGLTGLTGVFGLARPMIENVVTSVNNLMDSFNRSLETQDVKDFFSFLGDFAGPALETITQAAGNFVMGLFNMMEAFGPLATETQNSFLKMSESFRQWADGLSESEKFQSFVNYVSENMPKIRSIFSDAFQGIINTFAAFAPSSADMMSSLQDMMERFKKWSAALSESQGFQNFIDYIKTNGPVVVSTIGEIVTFIKNLGVALAPAGEKILEMVNSFTSWSNKMMEAHPWFGKIAAGALVLVGGLIALSPVILLAKALFGGLSLSMIKLIAKLTWTATMWTAKWLLMGTKALFHAARMAAAWVIALGPIGWISAIIIGLAILIIANWDKISTWTKTAWTVISALVTAAVDKIMAWIQEKFPAVYTIIQAYMTAVQEVISAVWEYIKGTFSNVLAFLKALVKGDFEGMKTAVSDQMELIKSTISRIWDAVKGYIGTVLSTIFGKVKEIFNQIKEAAVQKTIEMANKVVGKMLLLKNQALAKWIELKTKALITINELKQKATDYFVDLANKIVGKVLLLKNQALAKWAELKVKTLIKINELKQEAADLFEQIKNKIKEKMSNAVQEVGKAVAKMPGKVLEFVDDMVSAGADLVGGVISGIKSKISEGLGVIGGLATSLISRFKKDTDTHSPSRAFANVAKWFAPGIVQGINKTSGQAFRAVTELSSGLSNAFSPQLAMADMRASAQLDTSLNRADMGVVRKSFAAEIEPVEVYQGDTVFNINGREFARATADDMKDEMDRNSYQRNATSRRRGTN
ncbi:hypothetical protein AUC31_17545 [Planococcus rifietoensis]|uniref:Phage tail tape measure protein n=1 Tax=Planococcus rifietoensis TaxID=200991 RepID=A0A0U2ZLM0_9BACL|nr:hypothetical protein [Planococcus rifietoensis]ALS76913.1 hypothetical protein AUC31_17545 [Planococcus rifietoensis]